jgi:pSer/pThr/pTyr-binding forkhead associated (FHA) protein
MTTLLYCDVDGLDRTFELGLQPIVVGRAVECAIRSDDPRMSRQHARLYVDGDHAWVEDLSSANGVWVGHERVSRAPIPPGEVVVIGSLLLQVLAPGGLAGTPGGVHGQLSQWLTMERKARAAVEDERNAFAQRVGQLHEALALAGTGGAVELERQRDEALARVEGREQARAHHQ